MNKLISEFRFTPAIIALVAMNLIPLIGVFQFGWDAATIVFLYWLENVVIGLLNIPKIMACTGGDFPRRSLGGLLYLSVFYSFHYGLFCFGHYVFLQSTYESLPDFSNILPALFSPVLFWSLLGLTLSHVVSMIVNFFGRGEYKTRSSKAQMFVPYSRIVLLHIVIIFSGFLAVMMGQGLATLFLLVGVKIVFDLAAHIVEHAKAQSLIAPSVD